MDVKPGILSLIGILMKKTAPDGAVFTLAAA
jgi:hypothetical protein